MRDQTAIEPGVLNTFRAFTGFRAGVFGLSILLQLILRGWHSNPGHFLFLISFFEAGLLFIYLSYPRLSKRLGSWYLPVGILWATIGPILEQHYAYYTLFNASISENAITLGSWQLIPVLFIPLVIIAWQYSYRVVVLFCLGTGLLDVLLFIPTMMRLQFIEPPYPMVGVVMIRSIAFLFVGNMITRLIRVQREQRRELTQANTRLAQYASTVEELTVSRERNRLARELHDVLAHTLSELAVELEAVKAVWEINPPQAQQMLDHSLRATREGLTETRRALQELRASPLQDMGLGLAVRALAEGMTTRAGLRLEMLIDPHLEDYPANVQQTVYRVAQEALANTAEHAGARCVRVLLVTEAGRLKLSISDDGQGFDFNAVNDEQKYGLLGMRERVEMIGGQFSVESQPGKGTTIALTYGGQP